MAKETSKKVDDLSEEIKKMKETDKASRVKTNKGDITINVSTEDDVAAGKIVAAASEATQLADAISNHNDLKYAQNVAKMCDMPISDDVQKMCDDISSSKVILEAAKENKGALEKISKMITEGDTESAMSALSALLIVPNTASNDRIAFISDFLNEIAGGGGGGTKKSDTVKGKKKSDMIYIEDFGENMALYNKLLQESDEYLDHVMVMACGEWVPILSCASFVSVRAFEKRYPSMAVSS